MIWGLLIITILSIAISIYFKKDSSECLAFACFGIIFELYIFGIFNILTVGLWLIYFMSLIALIYIIFKFFKNQILFEVVRPYKLLLFFGIVYFLYFYVRGSKIICYDEFTAWSLFSKSMFHTDKLYIYNKYSILAKNYQSATAIFQYFITKTNSGFREDLLLMSMSILIFSMLFLILKKLKLKNIFEIIMRLLLIFAIPLTVYMWPTIYYTTLVDFILGITFGYILYYYFSNKIENFTFFNLSLAIFFLTCSKGNGLVLSLIALFIIIFDIILFKRKDYIEYITFKYSKYKRIFISLLPLIVCLFTYFSWFLCLKILKINSYDINSLVSTNLLINLKENLKYYIYVISVIFLEYKYFLLCIIVLIYTFLFCNISSINRKNLINWLIRIIIYIFCTTMYVLFLFIVCNTMASVTIATDALRRYLFTVVASSILLLLFGIINLKSNKNYLNLTLILVIILYFTTPLERQYNEFINKQYTKQSVEYRKQYDKIKKISSIVDSEKDIVYGIWEEEIDPYILNFTVFPISISRLPIWQEEISYKQYSEQLKSNKDIALFRINTNLEIDYSISKTNGYENTYLYIYKASDNFKKKYDMFFEDDIEPETLYKIEMSQELVKFKKII